MPDGDPALLTLDTRRRVYRYVEANPGMHLRGIQRALDMPLGTVEYHLHQMEKNEIVVSRDDGRFKAFFVKEGIDRRDKDVLYYVRQENPRRIIIQLLEKPGSTHAEVVSALPVGPSTVSFHLRKLEKAALVRQERQGRSKRFYVEDADRAARVLVRYRKSFLDDLVDRFASSWLSISPADEHDDPEDNEEDEDAETSDKKRPSDAPERGPPSGGTAPAPAPEPSWDNDKDANPDDDKVRSTASKKDDDKDADPDDIARDLPEKDITGGGKTGAAAPATYRAGLLPLSVAVAMLRPLLRAASPTTRRAGDGRAPPWRRPRSRPHPAPPRSS